MVALDPLPAEAIVEIASPLTETAGGPAFIHTCPHVWDPARHDVPLLCRILPLIGKLALVHPRKKSVPAAGGTDNSCGFTGKDPVHVLVPVAEDAG